MQPRGKKKPRTRSAASPRVGRRIGVCSQRWWRPGVAAVEPEECLAGGDRVAQGSLGAAGGLDNSGQEIPEPIGNSDGSIPLTAQMQPKVQIWILMKQRYRRGTTRKVT
ncbi:hypothetical protein NDU88_002933 [Pleurodeles waltl]|uniref:Uncharacterized protein n=1 Tax=Pleurodeles waltl TaxID=8319 RepID=A0AAV7SE83_PLEWA|nr:hypothetical protein NDU88_002933 [Pleurodeles waltl]